MAPLPRGGNPRGGGGGAPGGSQAGSGWRCPSCCYKNFGWRMQCRQPDCCAYRPTSSGAPRPRDAGDGGWPRLGRWAEGPPKAPRRHAEQAAGGGKGVQPPKPKRLTDEKPAYFAACPVEQLDACKGLIAEADWQAIRQQRFFLQQQLGSLSAVKPVRSAQVAADEAPKRFLRARSELERKKLAAQAALQAAFEQEKLVAKLQVEMDELVGKARRVMAEPPAAASPRAEDRYVADVTKCRDLVGTVSGALGGVELGELAGPLKSLLAALQQDVAACEASGAPPAAAAPSPAAGAQPGAAAHEAVLGGEHKAAGDDDEDMESLNLPPEAFAAQVEAFCDGDADKRKWLEAFRDRCYADNKQKLGCLTEQINGCNVLLFQETRLSGARTTDAEGELRRRGWRAAGVEPGVSGGGPGVWGLLTCSRLEHGLAPMMGYESPVVRPGRVQLLHHAGLTLGGVVVWNVYLESGAGVNAFNYEALRDVACRLKQYGRPCVIGGDFNCTKAELETCGVLRFFDGTCVDALEPTCAQSMRSIDMFIVERPAAAQRG
ncbi:unnamed protein product, partial [Prorocentrum cordatum]